MNRTVFFDRVRSSLFGGRLTQSQVEGMTRLIDEAARLDLDDLDLVAYPLATSFHETGKRMQPVREAYAKSDAAAVAALEDAWKAGKLGSVKTPYWRVDANGKSWFGRGDTQLTHEDNYRRLGDIIGVDLVGNPNLALDPAISARILFEGMLAGASGKGDFTGKSMEKFLAGDAHDFVGARAVVNGTDRAALIAGYAESFLAALTAAGWSAAGWRGDVAPVEPPSPAPTEDTALTMIAGMATALAVLAESTGHTFKWEISK